MAITSLLIDKQLSLPLHNSVSSHTHTGDEFIHTTSTPPHPAPDASSSSGTVAASAVFLRPRPLARCAGVLALVPLLPKRAPLKALPSEVWKKVLDMLVDDARREDRAQWDPAKKEFAWSLALVCRQFKVCVCVFLRSSGLMNVVYLTDSILIGHRVTLTLQPMLHLHTLLSPKIHCTSSFQRTTLG